MKEGEDRRASKRTGCFKSVVGVALGLILGALAGVFVGLLLGVGISVILGVL